MKRLKPEKERKPDIKVNGDAKELMEKQRKAEKKLFPLKINDKTTIYVPKNKCNDNYRKIYLEKINVKVVKLIK